MNRSCLLRYLFSFFVLVLLAMSAEPAWACRCGLRTPSDQFQSVDAVFAGRVDAVGQLGRMVTFNVGEAWKGVTEPSLQLSTTSGRSCGFDFEVGKEYLVYASGNTPVLTVKGCSRTSILSGAAEDLQFLSAFPVRRFELPPAPPGPWTNFHLFLVGLLAVLAVDAILIIRTLRKPR
jgi:hypothetical protein